jgi:hypothetical protein
MIELKSTSKKCFHFTLLELLDILLYGVEKLFKIIW